MTKAEDHGAVHLMWYRFSKLTEARAKFPHEACVYVQSDPQGRPVRVGKASRGLDVRYHGGNGGAMDAAMHGSGNLVFVAPVKPELCDAVERKIIWRGRRVLQYNNRLLPPQLHLELIHEGETPVFDDFED